MDNAQISQTHGHTDTHTHTQSDFLGFLSKPKIISIILGTGVVTGSLTGTGGVIQVRYFPLIGQYLLLILSSDSQVLRLVLGSDLSNSTHQVPLTPGLVCRDNQVR